MIDNTAPTSRGVPIKIEELVDKISGLVYDNTKLPVRRRARVHVAETKPIQVNAARVTKYNVEDIIVWILANDPTINVVPASEGLDIQTLEGTAHVPPGWWVVQEEHGNFVPCSNDVFSDTYNGNPDTFYGVKQPCYSCHNDGLF